MTFARLFNDQKGLAAFISIMIMLMLLILGTSMIRTVNDEITIAGNEANEMCAFYAAEAGIEMAAAAIQASYENTNKPPGTLPAATNTIGNAATMTYATTDNGPAKMKKLMSGSLSGLYALSKSFRIESVGQSTIDESRAKVSLEFECDLIPIFQFAVFFNEELWAQPIFDAIITGRVHANKDMYLKNSGAGKSLIFKDRVTCGGDIHAGFPYGASSKGDVRFSDNQGNEVSMNQGGTWIDSDFNQSGVTWYDTASALWGNQVRDKSFGQKTLNLPISGNDPHKIIERGSGNPDSFENKADFKIIDGVAYSRVGGVWMDVSAMLPPNTIVQDNSTRFYDGHEREWVRNTEIDMGLLKSSGYFPANGVVYISDQRPTSSSNGLNATSLVKGTEIGNALTIACENPVYVHGDYNTVNKKPASVICDAITFLSNNWDPSLSTADYRYRNATKTVANLSFITGDLAPSGTNYGGGLENLPRFLEDWNGTEFKFTGSMIEMWRSRQATGTWRYINGWHPYYSAPTRNWNFDTDLTDPNNLPPETPMVQVFQVLDWKQDDVGYTSK